MPAEKMRSIGAESRFCRAAWCSSVRLRPDQKSRSKASLPTRTLFKLKTLPKIAAQLAIDPNSSIAITSCTTKLASSASLMMERSWFMGLGFLRRAHCCRLGAAMR